jgi:predicted nucleic acid-binding protein
MTSAQTSQSNSIFVDSSVLISAAISVNGAARDLLLRGFRCDLVLYISDDVLTETERNLMRKAPEAVGAFCTFRDLLASRLVKPTPALVVSTAKVVEFKDAPIVAAAIRAKVRFLATYDRKHLLNQREIINAHFGITAATPDEILAALCR